MSFKKNMYRPDNAADAMLMLSSIKNRKYNITTSIKQIEGALELLRQEYKYLEEEEAFILEFHAERNENRRRPCWKKFAERVGIILM